MQLRLRSISPNGCRYMQPSGLEALKLTSSLQDNIAEPKLSLDGQLTFIGGDYTYLRDLDRSDYREYEINILIEELIDGNWVTKREAYLLLRDASFDDDRCTCKSKLYLYDKYSALSNALDKEYNLFNLSDHRHPASHSTISGDINNGILLYDALRSMIQDALGISNVISNFFQWNADDTNYTYGNSAKLHSLRLYQKSDIIRRNVVGVSAATIMTMQFSQLLNNICAMFNLQYIIQDDGAFRIEHVSYWQRQQTLDLTQQQYAKFMKGRNNWKYDSANIYQYESFSAPQTISPDFCNAYINYNNGYIQGIDTKSNDVTIELLTDVKAISDLDGTSDNADYAGVCIIACDNSDVIQDEAGVITFAVVANNVLAWQQLIVHYLSYGRPFSSGTVTSSSNIPFTEDYAFTNIRRTKLQSGIQVRICNDKDSQIDPFGTVLTTLGSGWINKLEYLFNSNILTLELLFAYDDSYAIAPPIAVDDAYATVRNTDFDSDASGKPSLLANDTNAVEAFVESIKTTKGGLVSIRSDGHFFYRPPIGYIGIDYFKYGSIAGNKKAAIGKVMMGIRPVNVYVHLNVVNFQSGFATVYVAYAEWYSDAAKTQPLNVTGFDITVYFHDSFVSGSLPASDYKTQLEQTIGTPPAIALDANADYIIV